MNRTRAKILHILDAAPCGLLVPEIAELLRQENWPTWNTQVLQQLMILKHRGLVRRGADGWLSTELPALPQRPLPPLYHDLPPVRPGFLILQARGGYRTIPFTKGQDLSVPCPCGHKVRPIPGAWCVKCKAVVEEITERIESSTVVKKKPVVMETAKGSYDLLPRASSLRSGRALVPRVAMSGGD